MSTLVEDLQEQVPLVGQLPALGSFFPAGLLLLSQVLALLRFSLTHPEPASEKYYITSKGSILSHLNLSQISFFAFFSFHSDHWSVRAKQPETIIDRRDLASILSVQS